MNERISHLLDFDISGAILSSLIIMAIVAVLAIIVGIMARRQDPLKDSHGLLFLAEMFVERLTNWVRSTMGEGWDDFAGYFMGLGSYLFLAFIWSITGLPSVVDYMAVPLSCALVMLVLIHATSVRFKKWGYFHRYIEPIALFLPINLLTMWTPVLSTTLRMFGNALSGFIVLGLVDWALSNLAESIFSWAGGLAGIFLVPIPTAVLNLYFALFSGFIQTLVFCSLNAVWIAQERPVQENSMGTEAQVLRPANNAGI